MTKIFASQGHHEQFRENTIDAFSAAVAIGIDGVELDLRRTIDGALVVHHDAAVEGQIIAETRQRDLPNYVPTLDRAIEACRGIELNIEMKNYRHHSEPTYDPTGGFARDVVNVVREHDIVGSTIVSCFDLDTCVTVRDLGDDVQVGWLLWDVSLPNSIIRASELNLTAVHPPSSVVDGPLVNAAHACGIAIYAWTAREPARVVELAKWNVDCLITDDPVGALAALGRR